LRWKKDAMYLFPNYPYLYKICEEILPQGTNIEDLHVPHVEFLPKASQIFKIFVEGSIIRKLDAPWRNEPDRH
jgi:hypothetical protein